MFLCGKQTIARRCGRVIMPHARKSQSANAPQSKIYRKYKILPERYIDITRVVQQRALQQQIPIKYIEAMRLRKHKTFPHTKTKHTGKQASERARVRATNMDRAVRGEDCVIETVIGSATQTHTQIHCERHAKQCRGLAPHIIRIICSYCVASTQTNEQSSL